MSAKLRLRALQISTNTLSSQPAAICNHDMHAVLNSGSQNTQVCLFRVAIQGLASGENLHPVTVQHGQQHVNTVSKICCMKCRLQCDANAILGCFAVY